MAGFTVPNQSFGVCNTVSTNLLTGPVSGLLGLGFQPIASSKAMPFWETLVSSGAWDTPVMGVQLTRLVDFIFKCYAIRKVFLFFLFLADLPPSPSFFCCSVISMTRPPHPKYMEVHSQWVKKKNSTFFY